MCSVTVFNFTGSMQFYALGIGDIYEENFYFYVYALSNAVTTVCFFTPSC